MMQLLRRKIRDNHILNLIEEGLKAKVFFNNKLHEHASGTPQGGILSPLLSNIYLNELDKFIDKIEGEYQGVRKRPRANPEYTKLMDKRGSKR
jgi:retron-type reverse transcriptase